MLFGQNTNVTVNGIKYHVQTEDRGTANALIDTTVHCRGRVMHRRTNNYSDLLPLNATREALLRHRLDEQHRAVIDEMRSGKLHLPPPPPEPPPRHIAGAASIELQTTAAQPSAPTPAQATARPAATQPPPARRAGPAPTHLKLELINAKNWLQGRKASLQVLVRDGTSNTVSGANICVRVDAASGPVEFLASSDANGRATLDFEMPRLASGDAALQISATHGPAQGQLRFSLRAKPKVPSAQ